MKNLIFAIFAFLAVFSCRSEDDTDVSPVVGEWEWVSSIGGVGNTTETPASSESYHPWFQLDAYICREFVKDIEICFHPLYHA